MVSKSNKAAPKAEKYPRKEVICQPGANNEECGRNYAKLLTSAELSACRIISTANPDNLSKDIDTPGMLAVLEQQAQAVQQGNMTQTEAMLINQATALQSLFTRLTERGFAQTHIPNLEGFMRLAFRAQSQCRATLETLAAIKNPPIVYARQANVTTGPQQINNGAVARPRARIIETEQTQLSGETHELLPNTRTPGNASQTNPTLETLGEIDRAEVPRR